MEAMWYQHNKNRGGERFLQDNLLLYYYKQVNQGLIITIIQIMVFLCQRKLSSYMELIQLDITSGASPCWENARSHCFTATLHAV